MFVLFKTEEPGFLKDEFIQHLNKFPKWEKTKYYCSSYTIYNCKTGRISPELKTGRELGKQPKYNQRFYRIDFYIVCKIRL